MERILGALSASEAAGADICVVPELAIPGYPPEDLLLKPTFVADNVAALEKVAAATGQCAIVVGYVGATPDGQGLSNAAALCAGGRVVGIYRKRFLPNYGVFDEQRWFVSSTETPTLFGVAGAWVGISVCEDVWFPDGPVAQEGRAGADVVVNLNASPYNRGRRSERLAMLRGRVAEAGCAIAYVNQVGGQDELVFDGDSLIVAADGTLLATGAQFATDLVVVDIPIDRGAGRPAATALPRVVATEPRPTPAAEAPPLRPAPAPELSPEAEVYAALVLGTHDYLGKNGFSEAVIGLSGGIDSSLVATIAVDALGPSHVHGISMPSRYSSDGSRDDAEAPGRAPRHRSAGGPHRAGPRGLHRHADRGARERAQRPHRREPPVPPARRVAHGRVQRQGVDRADHGKQERDGHRVLHPLRRLRRRLRGDQGRAQDVGLRPVPVPQRPGRTRGAARAHSRQRAGQGTVGRAPAGPARRSVTAAVREARPRPAGLRGRRPDGVGPGGPGVRSGGGRAGRPPGGRGRVQAAPDASGRAHHDQGLRQGPAHADHQPLPPPAARRAAAMAESAAPAASAPPPPSVRSTSWPSSAATTAGWSVAFSS